MNNTLELIQILDAIERHGSFEAASDELHKVRSALTYKIRKFEEQLGIKIYDRSQHRARLTESGCALLEQGRHLIHLSQQMIDRVKRVSTGWETVLRIAYDEILSTKPIFDLLKKFQVYCPQTNLELYSEILTGCMDALIHDRVDIAIGFPGPLISHPKLIFQPIGQTRFVFAVAPSHPLANIKGTITPEMIKKYDVMIARDSARQLPSRSCMILPEQRRMTFSSIALKKEAHMLGLGIGFLSYNLIKEEVKDGRLIIKEVEQMQPTSLLYIGWNKTKSGKAQRWFLKQIKNAKFLQKILE